MKAVVVGAGPSFERNIPFIRDFDGKIISVDKMVLKLIERGIIPDYVGTAELDTGAIKNMRYFTKELTKHKDKITVVYPKKTRYGLKTEFDKLGLKNIRMKNKYPNDLTNVGVFSIAIAIEVVKADKVYLTAMDHDGDEKPPDVFTKWMQLIKKYTNYFPNVKIINATGAGRLEIKNGNTS